MSNCDNCDRILKKRKSILQGEKKIYLCEFCFQYYENYKILYREEPICIPTQMDYINTSNWLSSHPIKKII